MKKVSKKEGLRRLSVLADYLEENVGDESFSICTWYSEKRACGCAIGYATQIEEFVKLGLIFGTDEQGRKDVPIFNDKSEFEAACEFFAIDEVYFELLFTVSGYGSSEKATRMNVVKKIRDFVALGGKGYDPKKGVI